MAKHRSSHRSRRSWAIAAAWVLLAVCPAAAQEQPFIVDLTDRRIVDYPPEGALLGHGWNSVASTSLRIRCIEFAEAQDTSQERVAHIQSVIDSHEFMSDQQISVEFKAKAIVGSASLRATFARQVTIKDSLTNFSVVARVRNGAKFVIPKGLAEGSGMNAKVDLTTEALNLAKTEPAAFFKQCGDSYIAALHGGAELSGVLTFRQNSDEDRKSITAAVEGSGWGLELKGSFSETVKRYAATNQLTILVSATGGSGVPIPTDQAGLIENIKRLPADAAAAPAMFDMTLESYDTLPSWPGGAINVVLKDMEAIAGQYWKLKSLYDVIEDIKGEPSRFILKQGVELPALEKLQDELQNRLKSLEESIKMCLGGQPCTMQVADKVDDYESRILLPVPKRSFDGDVQLRLLKEKIVKLETELAQLPPFTTINIGIGTIPVQIVNPAIKTKKGEIESAKKQLQVVNASYLDDLKAAIGEQWVKRASRHRCAVSVSDPGCLSNNRVTELIGMIVVH